MLPRLNGSWRKGRTWSNWFKSTVELRQGMQISLIEEKHTKRGRLAIFAQICHLTYQYIRQSFGAELMVTTFFRGSQYTITSVAILTTSDFLPRPAGLLATTPCSSCHSCRQACSKMIQSDITTNQMTYAQALAMACYKQGWQCTSNILICGINVSCKTGSPSSALGSCTPGGEYYFRPSYSRELESDMLCTLRNMAIISELSGIQYIVSTK